MTQEKKPGRSRIPITPERKEKIIALIERWTIEWGRLTGPTLETRVETCLGWKLSRIGMFKHAEIEAAFDKRRLGLDEGKPPKKRRPVYEEVTAQRIKRLEDVYQNERNRTLCNERFAVHDIPPIAGKGEAVADTFQRPGAAAPDDEKKALKRHNDQLQRELAVARAEAIELRRDMRRYKAIEIHLADTGHLPR